jgi:hypothetical protein
MWLPSVLDACTFLALTQMHPNISGPRRSYATFSLERKVAPKVQADFDAATVLKRIFVFQKWAFSKELSEHFRLNSLSGGVDEPGGTNYAVWVSAMILKEPR